MKSTKNEIDILISKLLISKFGKNKVERRDYVKLELENPSFLKGKSRDCGLMYLVDITSNLYIHVNIFDDKYTMIFIKDSEALIRIDSRIFKYKDTIIINYFLSLVNKYIEMDNNFAHFNSGKIPLEKIRKDKLIKVL